MPVGPLQYKTASPRDCSSFDQEAALHYSGDNNPVSQFLSELESAEQHPPADLTRLKSDFRFWFKSMYTDYLERLPTEPIESWEWQVFKLFGSEAWLGGALFLGLSRNDLEEMMRKVEAAHPTASRENGRSVRPDNMPADVVTILKTTGEWPRVKEQLDLVTLLDAPLPEWDKDGLVGVENSLFRRALVLTKRGNDPLPPWEIAATIRHEAHHIEYKRRHGLPQRSEWRHALFECDAYRTDVPFLKKYKSALAQAGQPIPDPLNQSIATAHDEAMRWCAAEKLPANLQHFEVDDPHTLALLQDILSGKTELGGVLNIDTSGKPTGTVEGAYQWNEGQATPLGAEQVKVFEFLEKVGRATKPHWEPTERFETPENFLHLLAQLPYDGEWISETAPAHYRIFMGQRQLQRVLADFEKTFNAPAPDSSP